MTALEITVVMTVPCARFFAWWMRVEVETYSTPLPVATLRRKAA